MPQTHRKLQPVGCNMNDAGYPFRGAYRLDDCINHGHSGVQRRLPTALSLRITGSNLVIEQLEAPRSMNLACELGVDGGIARPVSFPSATSGALAVPGDGRTYMLSAVVKNDSGKHHCRLSLNGSEGIATVRIRAPESGPPGTLKLLVNGKECLPVAGWYAVPLHAADCRLVLALPSPAAAVDRSFCFVASRESFLERGPATRHADGR